MRAFATREPTRVVVSTPGAERLVRWYADLLSGRRNPRVIVLPVPERAVDSHDASAVATVTDSLLAAARQEGHADSIGMLVSEWFGNDLIVQAVLRLAHSLRVPAVLVRAGSAGPPGRVLAATAGGPNVLEQMWIAKEVAAAHGIPLEFLHWRDGGALPAPDGSQPRGAFEFERLGVRILGVQADAPACRDAVSAESVAGHLRPHDLLVMGAPSPLRLSSGFAGTFPDRVARCASNALILVSAPPAKRISLRDLFWGGLIATDVRARDKRDVLARLIRNLADHNHLPRSSSTDMMDRALRREALMSTAVDCETAFPHIRLRSFSGIAATLAICPDGIPFGSPDGHPTRFVYLMVTPDGFCEAYLAALARIAQRMIHPHVRRALLACKSPGQALDILEPRGCPAGGQDRTAPHPAQRPHAGRDRCGVSPAPVTETATP